jgi:hypothetical protein
VGRLIATTDCSVSEGTFSSRFVNEVMSNPSRCCSSAPCRVHLFSSRCARNYSAHIERRSLQMHMGSHRAKMWRIVALSHGLPLPLTGSTMRWALRLRASRRFADLVLPSEGEWSHIFVFRDAIPGRREREMCWDSSIDYCLVVLSSIWGGVACRGEFSQAAIH